MAKPVFFAIVVRILAVRAASGSFQPERPAQEFRAGQPVAPRLFRRLGDADPRPDQDLARTFPPAQCKRRPVERKPVMPARDAERLGEPSRSRAEQAIRLYPAPGPHGRQSRARLERPDQDRAGDALALADEIETPVHPIGAVDIGVAGRAEHRGIACRAPAKTVRGGILVVIGFDLDDPSADAVDEQFRPDQIRGDVMDASREKSAAEERGFCLGHTEPREPEQHTPSWYSSERRRRSNDRVRISDFRDRLASPAAQFGAAGGAWSDGAMQQSGPRRCVSAATH